METSDAALAEMFATVMPLLDERQRRVLAGAQAKALGRGGIGVIAAAAGMARSTVQQATIVRSGPLRSIEMLSNLW